MEWEGKKVIVTGSNGMIGKELVEQLIELDSDVLGADISRDDGILSTIFDLTYKNLCHQMIENYKPDYIFHLAGIKGNPKMTNEKPVSFMGPMLQFDTNMILAAQLFGVKRFLYTSSIAVLNPETDEFPAWAKSTGEKLIEAQRIQNKGSTCVNTQYCVVRPANVYGRYDNFDAEHPMVITDLIKRALNMKLELSLWDTGESTRDFINAKDVARAMILVMEKMPEEPINLGTGKERSIKQVGRIICDELGLKLRTTKKQPMGNMKKLMDVSKLTALGFKPKVSLKEGIIEVIKCRMN